MGNRLLVREERHCRLSTSPPAQKEPLTLFASPVLPRSGCEGNTKDLSKGWGSSFVTILPWPCSVSRRQITAARGE